jgi:rod shape-determining protein MreC
MRRFKLRLMLISIGLIAFDRYSFINNLRDGVVIWMQKQTFLLFYRIQNYPRLLLLNTSQQQKLASQNVQLKKQIEEYSLLLKQSKNQTQNITAVNQLNPNGVYDDFNQIVAKAILDVNFFVNNQMLIDVGRTKGAQVGSAVVNREGIIGQILNVNANSSQVTLITNPEFKIYVEQSVTKSKMLAQGSGNGNIIVRYLDKNDKIQAGDILETTGLDDVYPARISVAKVVKVFYENNGFNSALCVPVVDFHQLQYVLVLKYDSK